MAASQGVAEEHFHWDAGERKEEEDQNKGIELLIDCCVVGRILEAEEFWKVMGGKIINMYHH